LIGGTLPTAEFPFVKEDSTSNTGNNNSSSAVVQSLRKGTGPKWGQEKEKGKRKSEKNGTSSGIPKIMVFIAGGMTLSEMRSVYEIAEKHNRDIIIGSTHIITPTDYINSLRNLMKVESVDDE